MPNSPNQLDATSLATGLERLAARDADLAAALAEVGAPPLSRRAPGFATLVRIVLEQQVSLASAEAAFDRLRAAAEPLVPATFLELSDDALSTIGFSRQKARYARELAAALVAGALDLEALAALSDDGVRKRLLQLTGIGPWTAEIYLLMALGRPDVWPAGDLALAKSVAELKGLEEVPDSAALDRLAERWRPWRAVAARLLWHLYLERRARPAATVGGDR